MRMADVLANNGSEMDTKKASDQKRFLWVNDLKEDITRLVQIENADVEDVLRVAKKFERKCKLESRKIKGPVRASKLVKAFTEILRHLKLVMNDVRGDKKILATLGVILTYIIAAASKSKECQKDPQSHAIKVYSFLKNVLDADAEWMFSTLLCSDVNEANASSRTFLNSLRRLIIRDPVLMSYDAGVVTKAMAVSQLVRQMEKSNEKNKLEINHFWLREPDFHRRSQSIDTPELIKLAKKTFKIKGFKSSQSWRSDQGLGSSSGVQWMLSTAPSEIPDFHVSDEDEDEQDLEIPDTDSSTTGYKSLPDSSEHPSDEEPVEVSEDSDIEAEEPSSKRKKTRS